jgi:alpha-glucosidase
VLSNHDVTRHPTRFGGGELGLRRARAATLLSLALPGGAYIYQGEELGLEEVLDIPAALRQDPIFARSNGERVGRDGCRVPLPWDGDQAPFGFGPSGTPWLPQPASWASLSVAAQEGDPGSTLVFYHAALRARRSNPALGDGAMTWIDAPDGVLAFRRGADFVCVINYNDHPVTLPSELAAAEPILLSSDAPAGTLTAATAAWLTVDPATATDA